MPVIHRGSGRKYKSFEEMFDDPAARMSPSTTTWEVSACSPEEIAKSYGAVETLAWKIVQVPMEHRQEAQVPAGMPCSASTTFMRGSARLWTACGLNGTVSLLFHIQKSEALNATGRIVITPSGVTPTTSRVRRPKPGVQRR